MHKLVAMLDFSDVTPAVLRVARQIAHGLGSRVYLIHVEMPESMMENSEPRKNVSRDGLASEMRRDHRALQVLQQELKQEGIEAVPLLVRSPSTRGNPASKIVETLRHLMPDLVVVGSHGHHALYQLLVGSVSEAVLRQGLWPVLVVPSPKLQQSAVPGTASA